jgi:hypothetical protein
LGKSHGLTDHHKADCQQRGPNANLLQAFFNLPIKSEEPLAVLEW